MEEFLGRDAGSRSRLIVRGFATLIVLAVAGAFTAAYSRGTFRDTVVVRAVIDDAGGSLTSRADVKARGVIVGHTKGVELTDQGVVVELELDSTKAQGIPANAKARILPATVFGTSYVDLVIPKGERAEALQAGQVVAQDMTSETLELQTTLDSANRVITAVKPAELAATLGAISQALEGRGDELGASMVQLEGLLSRVNPEMPLIRENIRLLADNLENVDRAAPDLFAAVDDGLVTSRTIVAKRADITTLLTGSAALVDEADRFLTAEEQDIVTTVRQTATVVDAFYDLRSQLAPGLLSFVEFGRRGIPALSDGPWLSTSARIVADAGAEYTSADCPRYGEARGDNCDGGAVGGSATPSAIDGDAALVGELQSLIGELGGANSGGIGELLSRPFVDEEGP